MALLEQVQTNSKGSAGPVASQAVSFASTPAKGNLLTCATSSDATVTMNSAGWTLAKSQVSSIGLYLWEKIAGESESKEVKCSPSVSDSIVMEITEWKAGGGGTIKLDKTAGANGSGTTCSSGETTETAQAEEVAIAVFGWQKATSTVSYSNSFTAHLAPTKGTGSSEGTSVFLCSATKEVAAKGKQTTTMTSTAFLTGTSGLIATFYVEGGGGGKAWKLELADTVTATDALVKGSVKAVADSITGSDAIAKATAKPLADSAAAVDALAKLPGKTLADSVTATDALTKQGRKGLSDAVTGAESISKATGKILADAATAADGLAKTPSKPLADSVAATDSIAKQPQKNLADSVTASDSLSKRTTKALADAVEAVESWAKRPARALFDVVTASDSIVARVIEKIIPLAERPTTLELSDAGATLSTADAAATLAIADSATTVEMQANSAALEIGNADATLEASDTSASLELQDQEAELQLNGR